MVRRTDASLSEFEKKKMASAPILEYFDPNAQMIITTDAQGIGLSAVHSQVSSGVELPVADASKTLSKIERNYSTGECDAITCGFEYEHWNVFSLWQEIHTTDPSLKTAHNSSRMSLKRSRSMMG